MGYVSRVSTLTAVMEAPGITAPEESATRPVMEARKSCACKELTRNARQNPNSAALGYPSVLSSQVRVQVSSWNMVSMADQ